MMQFNSRAVSIVALRCASVDVPRAAIPQQLTFSPYHATGLYQVGDTAPAFALKWTVRRNNAVVSVRHPTAVRRRVGVEGRRGCATRAGRWADD